MEASSVGVFGFGSWWETCSVSDKLCAQYDQAVTLITEYQAFRQSVWRKQFSFRGVIYLLQKDKFGGLFREAKREQAELPIHSSPIIKELADRFATEEQKRHPFYAIYTNEYPASRTRPVASRAI